jgi:hypothetical protein
LIVIEFDSVPRDEFPTFYWITSSAVASSVSGWHPSFLSQ